MPMQELAALAALARLARLAHQVHLAQARALAVMALLVAVHLAQDPMLPLMLAPMPVLMPMPKLGLPQV